MKNTILILCSITFLNAGIAYDKYRLIAKPIKFELTLQCEPVSQFAWWKVWKHANRNYYERSLLKLCTENQRKNKETILKVVTGSEDLEVKDGEFKKEITGFSPSSSYYGKNSKKHYKHFEVLKEVGRIVTYNYELQLIEPNNTYYAGKVIKKGILISGNKNKSDNIIYLSDINTTINKYTNSYDIDTDTECIDGVVFNKKHKSQIIEKKGQARKCPYIKYITDKTKIKEF